jgi:hypothetical protein
MTVDCPKELREHYHARRVIPFIGAGVSISVKWLDPATGMERTGPSWFELVSEAARLLGFDDPELLRVRGTDLQILEYFRIVHNSFAPLTNWLYTAMQPPEVALRNSVIHHQLAALKLCRLFYTTNYDNFIERAFSLNGRQYRRIAVEANIVADTDPLSCEVVKFHGDWDSPERMVLSESQYEERLNLRSVMDYRLRADLLGRVVLFLGYSFHDWNVSYLFRVFNEQFEGLPLPFSGRRGYITVANPSDFERNLFSARNIEVIPVEGESQAEDIASLLSQMRS